MLSMIYGAETGRTRLTLSRWFIVFLLFSLSVFSGCSSGGSNGDPAIANEYLSSLTVFPSNPQSYDRVSIGVGGSDFRVQYSWRQLQTPGVAALGADAEDAAGVSFVAPAATINVKVKFRVTATLPGIGSGSRDITVSIRSAIDCPRCSNEDMQKLNAYQSIFGASGDTISGLSGVVPDFTVTDSTLIFSDAVDSSLVQIALVDQSIEHRTPTDSAPVNIEYDSASSSVYTSLFNRAGVLRMDPVDRSVQLLTTSGFPTQITTASNSIFFLAKSDEFAPEQLYELDLITGQETRLAEDFYNEADIAYSELLDEIFVVEAFGSTLYRHRRTSNGLMPSVEMLERYSDALAFNIALSNDSQHLAVSGYGNVRPELADSFFVDVSSVVSEEDLVIDYNAADFSLENVRYVMGNSGNEVKWIDYSNNNSAVVIATNSNVQVFSVPTGDRLASFPVPDCGEPGSNEFFNTSIEQVKFSSDDNYLAIKLDCEIGRRYEFFIIETPRLFTGI